MEKSGLQMKAKFRSMEAMVFWDTQRIPTMTVV